MTYFSLRKSYIYLFLFALLMSFGLISQAQTSPTSKDFWIDVANDRSDRVRTQLNSGLDPNVRTEIGNPLIMQAVRDGAWGVFDVVLAHPQTEIDIMNGYQETPLMYVALVGDLERAKKLVAKGAQINHLGWTPLHYAAAKGHADVVEYLLGLGAMPNAPAPDGTTPIMMAAQTGGLTAVQILLKAGADPEAINLSGENAVAAAKNGGHKDLAKALSDVISKRDAQRQSN